MKKFVIIFSIIILVIATIVHILDKGRFQESITYFPPDPNVFFNSAGTSLILGTEGQNVPYHIHWTSNSVLNRTAYLRQDAGLLFANGRLIGKMGDWKQNTDRLNQETSKVWSESSIFQAITFHYAELHEKNSQIFSSQAMSSDQLYVFAAHPKKLHAFHIATTKEEYERKAFLDQWTNSLLEYSWGKGIRVFSIHLNQYHPFPLTQLSSIKAFPGFSVQETNSLIGTLWEGLYKNYFLSIKKADGTFVEPIGSTMPLILLASDKSHLLVLFETNNGDPILLRQLIESGH